MSTKRLIRESSQVAFYRLSSEGDAVNLERDPDNILLWASYAPTVGSRGLSRRVLQVAGQLDHFEDDSFDRRQPPPLSLAPEFNAKHRFQRNKPSHCHRAVYLRSSRGILPESLKLFDFADPSMATAQREETTVPSQASYLLNSPWMIEQAGTSRLNPYPCSPRHRARLTRLYRLALGRTPTEDEMEAYRGVPHRHEGI